jgi:hypothetical protein
MAIFAAIRRASSLVRAAWPLSAAPAHPLNLQKIVKGRFTAI